MVTLMYCILRFWCLGCLSSGFVQNNVSLLFPQPVNNADFIIPVEIDGTVHQVSLSLCMVTSPTVTDQCHRPLPFHVKSFSIIKVYYGSLQYCMVCYQLLSLVLSSVRMASEALGFLPQKEHWSHAERLSPPTWF